MALSRERITLVQIAGHKADNAWWDGPERYEYINRNIVAAIQRDITVETLVALYEGRCGLNVGGTGWPHKNFLGVNIDGSGDIFADARNMPFADGSVAYIFCHHSLEHIPDTHKLIAECMRVLEHGGILYCVAPDHRFFSHANTMAENDPFYAPSEMTADEFKIIIDKINLEQPHGKVIKELLWNTRSNNFEWNYMGKVINVERELNYNILKTR